MASNTEFSLYIDRNSSSTRAIKPSISSLNGTIKSIKVSFSLMKFILARRLWFGEGKGEEEGELTLG
jgi:hypothetical protein